MLLIIPIRLNNHSFIEKLNLNLKLVIMLEMQINVKSSLRDTLLIGIESCLKNEILKTQQPTYKIEDMNGEIIESKNYEQELLKSEFDFESNNKVLESLDIILTVNKYKDDKN